MEQIRKVRENKRIYIHHASNMVYNDIVYEIKRLSQRNLLVGKYLTESMHRLLIHHDRKQAAVPHLG